MIRTILLWFAAFSLLAIVGLFLLIKLPIPPKRTIYLENSPDGTMIAVYSYRYAGLAGLAMHENAHIYLDVYRKNSKKRILHRSGGGDVYWEAVDRLHEYLPWPAAQTNGQFLNPYH